MPRTLPGWTIAIFSVLGLLAGGLPGAVVGLILGVSFVLLIGALVRTSQGGLMPRKVRRDLTTNLLAQRGEAVQAAFSSVHGNELFRAVEAEIESLAHRATSMAAVPTHEGIWTPDNVTDAATSLLRDDPEPSRAALYLAILAQMHTDWETHTPLVKDVLAHGGAADLRAEDYSLAKDLEGALRPSGRLRIGLGAAGPNLEIVPVGEGDPRLVEPLLILYSSYNRDDGRALIVLVHPLAQRVVTQLLLPRGFCEMASEPGVFSFYSKLGV